MKKIVIILISCLVLFGSAYYFIFYFRDNYTNLENNREVNSSAEINKLETLENKALGYAFDYPADKYDAKVNIADDRQTIASGLYVKGVDVNSSAIVFYSHVPGRIMGRSGFFGDLDGYIEKDGEYFIASQKEPLAILDVLDTELGKVIVIDGTKFDYTGPSMGPGEFGALVNLENSKFTGVAIQPGAQNISYDEFLDILKTLRQVPIDQKLLKVDTSSWTLFEDEDLGISHLIQNDKCNTSIDTHLKNSPPVFTLLCKGRNGTEIMYEPLNYYQNTPYDLSGKTLEDVATTFYNVNKNFDDGTEALKSRELGELEKIKIGNYEAYKFSVSSPIVYPCKDDINKACEIRQVYYQDVIFVSDGVKMLMIRKRQKTPIVDEVLNSFEFINK